MKNKKILLVLASLGGLCLVALSILAIWAASLDKTIRVRMEGKRWAQPTQYFSAPEKFLKGQSNASKTIEEAMDRLDYLNKPSTTKTLLPGEFTKWSKEECQGHFQGDFPSEIVWCYAIQPRQSDNVTRPLKILSIAENDILFEAFEGTKEEPQKASPASVVELEPELFAQFYGGQPVLRRIVKLGEVSADLLNAIIAIEDSNFLEHRGVSLSGMIRAALRNIRQGGVAQGGSTLTQQLIKNYFLTPERTFKRKITEVLMALLLESRFTKDDILETYVNEVYLGQSGPFEIHGVASASLHFFRKHPDQLTLAECATLAGMIQSPNRYNPLKYPGRIKERRDIVLKRMASLKLITESDLNESLSSPVIALGATSQRDQAPYFVDAVHYQLKKMGIEEVEGLQVYTTLNMRAQQAATQAVVEGIRNLENKFKFIQDAEKKSGVRLQAALISADPTNGFVEAVVGGTDYKETQLNRAVTSKRQVGSIFKPFIYLTAFSSVDPEGIPYTPISSVLDAPFTVTYDKKEWSPQNYDNEYMGNVSLFQALQHSLNAATVKVALQVGLKKIAETAARAGVDTPLPALPSLALGAVELSPMEVLQAYDTLARRGELNPLTFVYRVVDVQGNELFAFSPARTQAVDAIAASQTVSLMEGTLERGTARSVRASGFSHPAAGKTGTTNDKKDAWFGGFTPLHSAVVWVGFDLPEPTGLTGGLAAAPIWTQYMKTYASRLPPISFGLPDGADRVDLDPESLMIANEKCPQRVALVFAKGSEPKSTCWLQH